MKTFCCDSYTNGVGSHDNYFACNLALKGTHFGAPRCSNCCVICNKRLSCYNEAQFCTKLKFHLDENRQSKFLFTFGAMEVEGV